MELDDLRTTVLRRLHAAAADGTLDHGIAMSRISRAERAGSADELDVLLAGLARPGAGAGPQFPVLVEEYPAPPQAAPDTADPGTSESSRIAYRATWRTVTNQGPWRVPAFLLVDPGYGTVLLDLVQAIPDTSVIDIRVIENHGWVKLVVPQGWGVDTDDLVKNWGYVGRYVPTISEPGKPQIVVRGNLGSGYLTLRHQKPRDKRRLSRYLADESREPKA